MAADIQLPKGRGEDADINPFSPEEGDLIIEHSKAADGEYASLIELEAVDRSSLSIEAPSTIEIPDRLKKAELMRDSHNSELETQISKLNAALAAGILSQDEYDTKKLAIEKQSNFAGKLKQLENAKDAGIITHEEFEQKKLVLIG